MSVIPSRRGRRSLPRHLEDSLRLESFFSGLHFEGSTGTHIACGGDLRSDCIDASVHFHFYILRENLFQVHVCARFRAVRGKMRSRGLEGELGSKGARAEVTEVGIVKAPLGPSLAQGGSQAN